MISARSTFRFFGLVGHLVAFCHSSHSCGLTPLKLGVASWYFARLPRLPIGSEAFPGLPIPGSTLEGVPPSPSLEDDMPASKVLETLLVCTCLAQSALSNDVNDDFDCVKVEKKFFVGSLYDPSVLHPSSWPISASNNAVSEQVRMAILFALPDNTRECLEHLPT